MDKGGLTERDISTNFTMPAVRSAGCNEMLQAREEAYFAKSWIIVRGKAKKADHRRLLDALLAETLASAEGRELEAVE